MMTEAELHAAFFRSREAAATSGGATRVGGLQIRLRSGIGTAPTGLAAFDAALRDAEIANFNLIRLSSVIPADAEVRDSDGDDDHVLRNVGAWGDRLYVVMADMVTADPGAEAWAGIGWVQAADRCGLFVEHCGTSAEVVRADIVASLASMVDGRQESFSRPTMKIRGATCRDQPVCALVAAVYRSDGWELTRHDALRKRPVFTPDQPGSWM
jgi:arginine decarboxylase